MLDGGEHPVGMLWTMGVKVDKPRLAGRNPQNRFEGSGIETNGRQFQ
jgi:hypothetical protein